MEDVVETIQSENESGSGFSFIQNSEIDSNVQSGFSFLNSSSVIETTDDSGLSSASRTEIEISEHTSFSFITPNLPGSDDLIIQIDNPSTKLVSETPILDFLSDTILTEPVSNNNVQEIKLGKIATAKNVK